MIAEHGEGGCGGAQAAQDPHVAGRIGFLAVGDEIAREADEVGRFGEPRIDGLLNQRPRARPGLRAVGERER